MGIFYVSCIFFFFWGGDIVSCNFPKGFSRRKLVLNGEEIFFFD